MKAVIAKSGLSRASTIPLTMHNAEDILEASTDANPTYSKEQEAFTQRRLKPSQKLIHALKRNYNTVYMPIANPFLRPSHTYYEAKKGQKRGIFFWKETSNVYDKFETLLKKTPIKHEKKKLNMDQKCTPACTGVEPVIF